MKSRLVLYGLPNSIMSNFSATTYLADLVASRKNASLPTKTVHDFKRSFLDYLACLITGSNEQVVANLMQCLLDGQADQTQSAFMQVQRFQGKSLAFVNGVRAHALDYDDGYTQGSCHPGAVIFSAVLAAAKKYGVDKQKIIQAVVVGYEVMLRISSAMHPTTAKFGFHNTSVAGVFGATAGASVMLNLNAAKSLNALGLSASYAGGILQFLENGSDAKRLHAGKAAHDGLLCAEMAAAGISGPAKALEGNFGFFRAYARNEIRESFLSAPFVGDYLISQTYIKLYPCCRHYHGAIDAASSLKIANGFDVAQIDRVEIGLYGIAVDGHDQTVVRNLMEAQMSAPCAVSLAILDGLVTQNSFMPESLMRSELKQLMSITKTMVDSECEASYPKLRSGVVRIFFKDGRVIEKRVQQAKGEALNPLEDNEIERKFFANTKEIIGEREAIQLKNLVWNFENADLELLYRYF